jgi:hypothetical protein
VALGGRREQAVDDDVELAIEALLVPKEARMEEL